MSQATPPTGGLRSTRPLVLLVAALAGCGNEYVCPDPVGRIVRDDCDDYKTRYESLKVELGFSIGKLGFSFAAGKEKLRDPSELLQVLMQQTMSICKDFNACRVPMVDYQRRREDADRKFTAITAITQQLKGDLDVESKRKLVAKLIDVITATAPAVATGELGRPSLVDRPRFSPGFFRDATSIWFGSRFQPTLPSLPQGVPVVAQWEVYGRNTGSKEGYVHLTLWGKTEVDDRIYIKLTDPPLEASEKVRPMRGRPEARVSFHFKDVRLRGRGSMTLSYRPGATGQKQEIGTASLDVRTLLGRGYLSYMPDPVRVDPIEYERACLVFYTRVDEKTRVTLRCEQNGKPEPAILTGLSRSSPYEAGRLRRHHFALPIRIPLKGGTTRGTWRKELPGEQLPVDRFPAEAAGLWVCRASLNGRPARRLEFRLRPDGSVVPAGMPGRLSPPWWPIKTERIDNEVEREREKEIAEEEAEDEKRP